MKLFLGIALAKSSLKNGKVTRLQYWILVSTLPEISKDHSIILLIYFCFIHDFKPEKWLKIPKQDYQFVKIFMSTIASNGAQKEL
jgi:hypothetical protein